MLKWLCKHKVEIIVGLLILLTMFLVTVFGIGLDCLLHGVNCPPVTNCTGCV